MPLELVTIPALSDNYAYLLHDGESGATACIDVPEAPPIAEELDRRGWRLSEIWLTHHHWDHVDGLADLLAAHPARVTGARADAGRLPSLDREVAEGDRFDFGTATVEVIEVPGHTLGHIAYHVPEAKAVFTADSLMALGCGRLFEGTPEQMWASLEKLSALPPDTAVCSGHEYTASNAKFALTIEPGNEALISRARQVEADRAQGKATVPSLLSEELATNPFLRTRQAAVQSALGMDGDDPIRVFAEIRARKDRF